MEITHKAVCVGASFLSMLGIISCNKKEIPQQNSQPQKVEAPYQQTNQLADTVLELSKNLFPRTPSIDTKVYKGAIHIGKDKVGEDRYAVVETMEDNRYSGPVKSLRVNVYTGLDQRKKAELDLYLSQGLYGAVAWNLETFPNSQQKKLELRYYRDDSTINPTPYISNTIEWDNKEFKFRDFNSPEWLVKILYQVYGDVLETVQQAIEWELRKKEISEQGLDGEKEIGKHGLDDVFRRLDELGFYMSIPQNNDLVRK